MTQKSQFMKKRINKFTMKILNFIKFKILYDKGPHKHK